MADYVNTSAIGVDAEMNQGKQTWLQPASSREFNLMESSTQKAKSYCQTKIEIHGLVKFDSNMQFTGFLALWKMKIDNLLE